MMPSTVPRAPAAPPPTAAPAAPGADTGPTGETGAAAARALALYAQLLAAPDAAAAAQGLVDALARGTGEAPAFDRVSLGFVERDRLVLAATSGHDGPLADGELAAAITGAMEEASDQGLTLAEPPLDGRDLLTLELRALRRLTGGTLACMPLAVDGVPLGALLLERHDGRPIGAAECGMLEHLLALAAPALQWRRREAEPLPRLLRRRLAAALDDLRRPSRTRRRRWLGAALAAFALLALAPLPQQVGGRARLEGAQQRVLAAPTDGFIQAAHVRPGDRVKAGDLLVELREQDLQLERERWASQQAQHENAYAAAMARADRAQAAMAAARLQEAQAQLALVDEQLGRSRVTAPIDAVVIQGDLAQSIGAPVRQGDALITLAASEHYRVMIEVDEVDVARVVPGQAGTLRLSAWPWDGRAIVVERIAPLSHAVDGRNVFDVQARLVEPDAALRPGQLGRGRVEVGHLPPLWSWLRPLADRARLAVWAWGGP